MAARVFGIVLYAAHGCFPGRSARVCQRLRVHGERRADVSHVPIAKPQLSSALPTSSSTLPVSSSVLPTSPSAFPTSKSEKAKPAINVYELLSWQDLPYDVPDKSAAPTLTDHDPSFDQSCQWRVPIDNLEVGVALRFLAGKTIVLKQTNGEFTVGDRKVSHLDETNDLTIPPSCTLAMDYAGGGAGIIVADGSSRFGAVCEQGRKVAEILLTREPK